MRQQIHVEMDDGTAFDVEADGRDLRAWEAAYERSWFGEVLSFTNLAQVAYLAGRRTGVINGTWPTYESFDAHCVDAVGRRAPVVGTPTPPARTAGSSAPSPSASGRSPRGSRRKTPTPSPPSST
jgi:hypothetical protein